MDVKKQQLLVEYLISSSDIYAICHGKLHPDYFDPELRNPVRFISKYYEKYGALPEPEQIESETGRAFLSHHIKQDKIDYCLNELEKFAKRKALETAVVAAANYVADGNYAPIEQIVKDALLTSFRTNLGLRYFDDPGERLRTMLQENATISTKWDEVDRLLFGGISRKELLLFSANSGGGKSITLTNLALNFVEQGLNVLYVSLELSEPVIAQRVDTMITGVSRKDWKQHVDEITTRVLAKKKGSGNFDIIQMRSGTKAHEIEALLKEYELHHGVIPDLLVVDYLDKMHPNQKEVSLSDVWTKDKYCSEQLRDLGVAFNLCVATASQLNRSAINAQTHDHSHIAGGISKINESDTYISIKLTDEMKAKGECAFHFQKTRNSDGVGHMAHLKWNQKYLRIENKPDGPPLTFDKKDEYNNDEILNFVNTEKDSLNLVELMSSLHN